MTTMPLSVLPCVCLIHAVFCYWYNTYTDTYDTMIRVYWYMILIDISTSRPVMADYHLPMANGCGQPQPAMPQPPACSQPGLTCAAYPPWPRQPSILMHYQPDLQYHCNTAITIQYNNTCQWPTTTATNTGVYQYNTSYNTATTAIQYST